MRRPCAAIFLTILLFTRVTAEQSPAVSEPRSPGRVEGLRGDPAPPLPPEVIARDDDGHATVRAIALTSPLRVDGKLDEEVYQRELPFGGFIQVAPRYGAAQTERSDVWVMFDREYIYVSCRCWDSEPADKWIANELRRDTAQLRQNDQIGVSFDTFYDRRSGFAFYTNPLGARADYSIVDEGAPNSDWNPVWEVKTGRFLRAESSALGWDRYFGKLVGAGDAQARDLVGPELLNGRAGEQDLASSGGLKPVMVL